MPQQRPAASETAFSLTVAAFLAIALVLGGATHGEAYSSAVVRLGGLILLGWSLVRITARGAHRDARWPLILLAAIVLLPLIQLLPLPPGLWSDLPGRESVVQAYHLAGAPLPWAPISLEPDGTWDALYSLIPPAAMFLAVLTMEERARRRLTLVILGGALLATVLGALQVGGGNDSILRFYSVTNADSAVGFFANRNHHAAFLVVALPITAYWLAHAPSHAHSQRLASMGVAAGLVLVFLIGLGVTRSRAGVMLGVGAILASAALLAGSRRVSKLVPLVLVGVTILGGGLIAIFAFDGLMARFQDSLSGDIRVSLLSDFIKAGQSYFPVGSGLGSFVHAFEPFERPETLLNQFVNHAHDEYVEIWIEAGVAGAAVVAAALAWFAVAAVRSCIYPAAFEDHDLPRVASIIVLLLLIHSIADYPLRTAAMASIFACTCGLMIPPKGRERASRRRPIAPANDGGQMVLDAAAPHPAPRGR